MRVNWKLSKKIWLPAGLILFLVLGFQNCVPFNSLMGGLKRTSSEVFTAKDLVLEFQNYVPYSQSLSNNQLQLQFNSLLGELKRTNSEVFSAKDPGFEPSVKTGSNHLIISAGDMLSQTSDEEREEAWFGLNGKKPIQPLIGFFHLDQVKSVNQLKRIRASGQQHIAIMLWHCSLGSTHVIGIHGHCIDSAGGRLRNQHALNLENIVKTIAALKFNSFTMRFAPQGNSEPESWNNKWQENIYQENWNFINLSRQIVLRHSGNMKVMFDLAVESGGIPGFKETYVSRLLSDYSYTFGFRDTYGASVAWDYHGWTHGPQGRVHSYLKLLKSKGLTPPALAVDVYDNEYESMRRIRTALDSLNMDSRIPVIIQESWYNDTSSFDAFMKIKLEGILNITHIYQWPNTRGHAGHFAMDFPENATTLQSSYIANLGLGCDDNRCIWLSGANFPSSCSIKIFAGNWENGGTPIAVLSNPTCNSESLVTFRIPDSVYNAHGSINVMVISNNTRSWSEPRLIKIR